MSLGVGLDEEAKGVATGARTGTDHDAKLEEECSGDSGGFREWERCKVEGAEGNPRDRDYKGGGHRGAPPEAGEGSVPAGGQVFCLKWCHYSSDTCAKEF